MPVFSIDRSVRPVERPYSPQRAMRAGALAGAGSLLAMIGIMVSGGGTSAGGTDGPLATANTAMASGAVVTAATAGAGTTTISPTTISPTTIEPATVPTTLSPTTVTAAATRCTNTYTIVAGDYWNLIASEASVSSAELYAVNNASADTALFPGETVCLPDGASVIVASVPETTTPSTPTPKSTTSPAPVAPSANSTSHSS